MALYTFPDGTNRAVEAKGDIQDAITNIAPNVNVFLNMLNIRGTQDASFSYPEDSFEAVDLDNAHSEGADAPEHSDTARSLVSGTVQIMMKSVGVSDMQNRIAQYGIQREFDYQKAKKLVELKRSAEAIALSDQSGQEGTSANNRVWKMNGIGSIITSNTNDAFSEGNFDTLVEDAVDEGGEPTVVLCDADRKSAISDWTTNITRFSNEQKKLEKEVMLYHGAIGPTLQIKHHPLMPVAAGAPNVLGLQNEYNSIRVLMDLVFKNLADGGGGPRGLWKWIFGLMSTGEKAQFQFYDL